MRPSLRTKMWFPLAIAALAVDCGPQQPETVECLTSADCAGGEACEAHRCVPQVACTSASQCPQPSGPCEEARCEDGFCGPPGLKPAGTPIADQNAGDCRIVVCDESGGTKEQADNGDEPDDSNPCVTASCHDGTLQTSMAAPGTTCPQGVCDGEGHCGACVPGDAQCVGDRPRTCGPDQTWSLGSPCEGDTPVCLDGACAPPPSCQGLAETCGPAPGPCCATLQVEGNETFLMGRGFGEDADPLGNADEEPEHVTTLSAFVLDVYPVTVGRFRRFADSIDTVDPTPAPGAGAKPGLAGSGWREEWNSQLPASREALVAGLTTGIHTWTEMEGENENKPIVRVTWFEAFAFCVRDGGRLPTEQEWEYAAAGGSLNRKYPWGSQAPDATRAVYGCPAVEVPGCGEDDIAPVGSKPAGAGWWGHLDLAGNAAQWVLDEYDDGWYSGGGFACTDCGDTSFASPGQRVVRGGGWSSDPFFLRAASRGQQPPFARLEDVSFRCARPL